MTKSNRNKTQMPNSTVLTNNELIRMKNSVNKQATNNNELDDENKRLHEMSQKRASQWTNTVDALREKELQERELRKQLEEEILKKNDEKEEKIREAHRQAMIKRANRIKQENSDHVRQFKTKLMMCDFTHERAQQDKIKEYMKQMEKENDQYYYQLNQTKMKQFDKQEQLKKQEKIEKMNQTKKIIQQQLELVEQRKELERQRIIDEGNKLLQIAKEEEQKAIDKQQKRLQRIAVIKAEQKQWLTEQIQQKQELSKLDAVEDAKIIKYAQEKERIEKIRKEKESKRFAQKQAIRQKLIDEQTKYLEAMGKNEDTRIAQQIAERDAKDASIEQAKQEYQDKLLKECLLQCKQQNEKKIKDKQQQMIDEKKMLEHANKQFEEYNKELELKELKRRNDAIEIQKCLKSQIINKKRREIIEQENEREYMNKMVNQYNQETKELTEWANNKVKEYAAMGLNVTHLLQ